PRKHDRYDAGRLPQRRQGSCTAGQDNVRRKRNQLGRIPTKKFGIARAPAMVDAHIAAIYPAGLLEAVQETGQSGLPIWVVGARAHEYADPPHPLALLRARHARQHRRAAESRDERAPFHSITSSATVSSLSGTVRPRVLAVCWLMTSSSLVDCTTGRSVGLAPLRMRPT